MGNTLRIGSTIHCDVLIIGAGGAGLRCAAEIFEKKPGTRIMALTKVSRPQKSHTVAAQGGMAAVDPRDPIEKPIYHMFDTWKGSDCTADQNIIKKIVDASWEQIAWLENHGMHFSRDENGGLSKRAFGGMTLNFGESSAPRAVFEADRTGKGIMDTVWGEGMKGGISFLNQSIATELIFNVDRCVGAIVFKEKEGEFVAILSKATVFAPSFRNLVGSICMAAYFCQWILKMASIKNVNQIIDKIFSSKQASWKSPDMHGLLPLVPFYVWA